ncbi:hypothetical protein GCM10010129_84580 [Streptomyces fumigatiscleroticus]|nr:hypothetical protein GCM10010129_84580 [Streptomyces fumigatiscleroticus]
MKAQNAVLEKETKEKDSTISSLESELQVLREWNTQLAENNNLLQIREEAAGERHRAMLEEVVGKAKMAGALWFKDNTLKRHPETTSCYEWFEAGDGDESSGSSDSETDDDGQT